MQTTDPNRSASKYMENKIGVKMEILKKVKTRIDKSGKVVTTEEEVVSKDNKREFKKFNFRK